MSVQNELIDSFNMTAERLGMQIHLCLEDRSLVRSHVDAEGCFSKKVIENAIGKRLLVPTPIPLHGRGVPVSLALILASTTPADTAAFIAMPTTTNPLFSII